MFKYLFRLLKKIEEKRRARIIFKQGRYESYKQKHIREMAIYVLYEANKKLWDSGLPKEKIGELFLIIGKLVQAHQEEFSKEVKVLFARYETLKKLNKADPVLAIQEVNVLQIEYENALKKEVNFFLKKELHKH